MKTHRPYPPCPQWCTTLHDFQRGLSDLRIGTRDHWAVLTTGAAGETVEVGLNRSDDLASDRPGPVLVIVGDASLGAADASRLAAAVAAAAGLAEQTQ